MKYFEILITLNLNIVSKSTASRLLVHNRYYQY